MPHKHKRKRGDDADYELPPTQNARPLPVASKKFAGSQDAPTNKRKKGRNREDDAPRAFRRLMAAAKGKKIKLGLDNGNNGKMVVKEDRNDEQALKIKPGEDLKSFSIRVNAALPVAGLTKKTVVKDGKDEAGMKVYKTRKERKMHKLYDQWRAEDLKIKDRREEELEDAEERELDDDNAGMMAMAQAELEGATSKKKKKSGQSNDDDPWLELKRKRAEARVGLHDTAQAPPELNKKMSKQLTVAGAAVQVGNVPKAAGSLRRREELQEVRADVVDAYRKIREHEQAKLNKKNRK